MARNAQNTESTKVENANEIVNVHTDVTNLSDKEKSATKKAFSEYVKGAKAEAQIESLNSVIKSFYKALDSMELKSSVGASDLKKASKMLNIKTANGVFSLGFELATFGSFDLWQTSRVNDLLSKLVAFDAEKVKELFLLTFAEKSEVKTDA